MTASTQQRGRPCGLTPQKERLLLNAISRGLPYKHAAALAGISYMTFNRWKKSGSKDNAPQEFRDFCDRLETAEAKAADTLLQVISKAARTRDWKAAAWILERRYPDEWVRRESSLPQHASEPETEALSEYEQERIASSFLAMCEHAGTLRKLGYVKGPIEEEKGTPEFATVSKVA